MTYTSGNAQRAVKRSKVEFNTGERDLKVIIIETVNKSNDMDEISEGPI